MVRSWIVGVALLVSAGAAHAARPVDWRRAGGDVFVTAPDAPRTTAAQPAADQEPARLPDPRQPFADPVAVAAARHNLDPKLLHALVAVESGYRPHVCSRAGACGLTQLMPATAAAVGVADRLDPVGSVEGGAAYLARQVLRFGDLRLALAAYNAGPGRVAELGHVPAIVETRAYVTAVIDCYLALSAGRGVRSAGDCQSGETRP